MRFAALGAAALGVFFGISASLPQIGAKCPVFQRSCLILPEQLISDVRAVRGQRVQGRLGQDVSVVRGHAFVSIQHHCERQYPALLAQIPACRRGFRACDQQTPVDPCATATNYIFNDVFAEDACNLGSISDICSRRPFRCPCSLVAAWAPGRPIVRHRYIVLSLLLAVPTWERCAAAFPTPPEG